MATSVSAVTSHFPDAENGFSTTTSGSVASGATTVGLNSVAGYTNGEPVVFIVDPANSKKQTFTGIMDTAGSQVTGVVWTAGTNVAHDAGATVVDYATATHIAMISKGIKVEHNQDGTHDEALITSRTEDTSPADGDYVITSDVSASNGLKKVTRTNFFLNPPLGAGSVDPGMLNTGADSAAVATSEGTTSDTYTDLATAGPAVTVTIGANGLALVSIFARATHTLANQYATASLAVSGASTVAAGTYSSEYQAYANNANGIVAGTWLVEGLTAGSNTFTMKYLEAVGGTATFSDRRISVVPL